MRDEWYIQYDPIINEEMFQKIVDGLLKKGTIPRDHAGYEPNYKDFKRGGYLRGYVLGDSEEDRGTFCTDNNPQSATEIPFADLLNY